ncbi:se102 [Alphabaculovirus alterspexiguae]|uniref:Se102 n=1 Tax=Spodoptera exigua multiple nucleopolyhedrovirus TaxID=10454 RepID=A0A3G2JTU2_9ABAC|nr:se102 [Spodoptera exigua multiple nucleopolyhedrovirus]AYN45062.1 se102 [Spodoptera exigua multiple nucleopolyhedrovirus]
MNKYTTCYLCEEIVYLYKAYSNNCSDNFFNNHRAITKQNFILCPPCYRTLFVYKLLKLK